MTLNKLLLSAKQTAAAAEPAEAEIQPAEAEAEELESRLDIDDSTEALVVEAGPGCLISGRDAEGNEVRSRRCRV